MILRLALPPDIVVEKAKNFLTEVYLRDGFGTPKLRKAQGSSLGISTGHHVFTLDMERIPSDCTLSEKVICKGWRFLVHSDQQVVASLRLRNDGAEASWRIHSLTEGDNVSGTVDGLRLGEVCCQMNRRFTNRGISR